MLRRDHLTTSVFFAAVVLFAPVSFAQSHTDASPPSTATLVAGPYLQVPQDNAMTVMWLTDKKCTGWVEYGTGPDNLAQRAFDIADGLINANRTIHKITLTDLEPGSTYFYRVQSEEILQYGAYFDKKFSQPFGSDVHSFKTSSKDADTVSVVCFNDVHDNHALLSELLSTASELSYDAVFFNGDIMEAIYNVPDQIVTSLLGPCVEHFAEEIPFLYARGNHEARGAYARQLKDYVASPGPGNFYYAFTHGPVHFIVLDGGEDKVDSHPVYANLNAFDQYRTEQANWLKEHVQTDEYNNARWRVLMSHMPFESTARSHGVRDAVDKYVPHLDKVDISIAGHTHAFRIVEPSEEQPFPIVIGGNHRKEGATVIHLEATRDEINVSVANHAGQELGTYHVRN